ncbi:MAG: hypothetical protein AB1427_07450 [Thermodesulfobacteriota bacterium]
MQIIELIDYTLEPEGARNGLNDFSFSLSGGDGYAVETDSIDDAVLFLKAVVTWVSPQKGIYRFNGVNIDLDDYRNSLLCKRKIGYIASDAALISNRTVRDNLIFMRCYHEDSLLLTLDDTTAELCRKFDIADKLDRRPGELHPRDIKNAITIRELSKSPDVLVLERPEDFIDHTKFDLFKEAVTAMTRQGLPVVFYSSDRNFINTFSNKKARISKGRLTFLSS